LWHKSKVVYNEDYGCTIVRDFSEEEILDRPALNYESNTSLDLSRNWPVGDKIYHSTFDEVDYSLLKKAVDSTMSNKVPYFGTRALLVVYKDELIVEEYADGYDAGTRLLSWSMAKSVSNALVGIMSKRGKIDINQPILMPGWEKDERSIITWNDMLHMSAGLEWEENYGNESDVNVMLHKVGDFGAYMANKMPVAAPDEIWNYSSGSTNLVCLKLKDYFETIEEYYNFPYDALFSKINMKSVVFETDASGTYVGSSYLYATARDFTRFGMLYLHDGNWMGDQILPEGWVDYTRTSAKAAKGEYGSYFWLNQSGELPDVPADAYSCEGHDGQYIFIIPSKDLVIVRLGFSKKGQFDLNRALSEIIAAFPE
jgi:hypothetical protein